MRVIIFLLCWAVCWGGSEAVANNPQTVRLQAYSLEPSLQPDPNQSERERVSKKRARTWAKKVQKRLPKAKNRSEWGDWESWNPVLLLVVGGGLFVLGIIGLVIGLSANIWWLMLSAMVVGLLGSVLCFMGITNTLLKPRMNPIEGFLTSMILIGAILLFFILYGLFVFIIGLSYGVLWVWLVGLLIIVGAVAMCFIY